MNNTKYYCVCKQSFRKKHYFINHKNNCEVFKLHEQNEIQKTLFKKYSYTSLNHIEYINNVPKVVFICWFGIKNNEIPIMSQPRFNALNNLLDNIGVPVIIITELNYKCFIKKEYPLHKAFEYLSGVHKSDYMRCYLLLHYGGGYHDIKFRNKSWENVWNDDNWTKDNNIWMYGRREKKKTSIGYPPGMNYIVNEFNKLVTMGWIICKPNTLYLKDLVNQIEEKLDYHINNLIKYPAKLPGGYYFDKPFDLVPEKSYPIRWLEILGELFHPLMLKYNEHIKFGLPDANKRIGYK